MASVAMVGRTAAMGGRYRGPMTHSGPLASSMRRRYRGHDRIPGPLAAAVGGSAMEGPRTLSQNGTHQK
ncbi:unnamed protein product [Staurois parvus]|uniref:Uncharacterized protein n=1 Tax=Staurois parvus TaxID=386267 RepID=A0ABN9H3U8_9NEOB|nr:unnamed protein product [Staurois parvus]